MLLKDLLDKHDSKAGGYALRIVAIRALLDKQRNLQLPRWLTDPLSTVPHVLLRVYVEYDRQKEGLEFALNLMNSPNGCMPWTMFDALQRVLKGNDQLVFKQRVAMLIGDVLAESGNII
jgi:hypothetical protein